MILNFTEWFGRTESYLINEDFKSQRQKFIAQNIGPEIVDRYLAWFKDIRDKKFKELFAPIDGVTVASGDRNNIDKYLTFDQLEKVVDYVKGQKDLAGKKFTDIKFEGKPIYAANGLEIYYADSPRACIEYKGSVPYSWCIARSDASNMYYTYRFKEHEPAFYFVKDLEKTKAEFGLWNATKSVFSGQWRDKYHFFVVQVIKNADVNDPNKKQYIVTSAQNDGDTQMSWNDLLKIEPKLQGLQSVFAAVPLPEEEKKLYNRFNRGISDAEFAKLDYSEKNRYLDIFIRMNRRLTDKQFNMLPEDLKNKYIGFGVGLTDGQYDSIKNDKALMKRYEQITLRKIDELKKNYDITLLPSEVSIFLDKKPEEFVHLLDTVQGYDIVKNLLGGVSSASISKLSPNQQEIILHKLYDYSLPTADPGMLEKLVAINWDYLTPETVENIVSEAVGREAAIKIALKIIDLLKKRYTDDLPGKYIGALANYESYEYLDEIGYQLYKAFGIEDLSTTGSEKLARALIEKYGKDLPHGVLIDMINYVPNSEVAKIAFQMRDKMSEEDVREILSSTSTREDNDVYNALGHHAVVMSYPDGYSWVYGGDEHSFYLVSPDKEVKVKLHGGDSLTVLGAEDLRGLFNREMRGAGKIADIEKFKQEVLSKYESPSRWNDYILDFIEKKPNFARSISFSDAWSVGDLTKEQRQKLFKIRPDLLPKVNLKTSDGYIWIHGRQLGEAENDLEYSLLDNYNLILLLHLDRDGYLASGIWFEGDLFKPVDKKKYSLATAEFILHNNIEHFDVRHNQYGWKFSDLLPEHQKMVLSKFPDFVEPLSLIKKLTKGNKEEMLSQVKGIHSMKMLDDNYVIIDDYHAIKPKNLLNYNSFNLSGGNVSKIVNLLDSKIHGDYSAGSHGYNFEDAAKHGIEHLKSKFPFADEEMAELSKKHGYRTHDALVHGIGSVIMPQVFHLLYEELKPFETDEFKIKLKDNGIYFVTTFDNVINSYRKGELKDLVNRYKEWRKGINVNWERFIKGVEKIERNIDKDAFRDAITGKVNPSLYSVSKY